MQIQSLKNEDLRSLDVSYIKKCKKNMVSSSSERYLNPSLFTILPLDFSKPPLGEKLGPAAKTM